MNSMNGRPERRLGVRVLPVLTVIASSAVLLAGCGGDSKSAGAPGSADNPLAAQDAETGASTGRVNESSSAEAQAPGYQKLLERQNSRPQNRFSPCNLVTAAQARDIVGGPVHAPVEAPQGPTCIYRSQAGDHFVTVAVQASAFDTLYRKLRHRERVPVGDRVAYCGTYGQPMLYLRVSAGRVLSIAAPCDVASKFADRAIQRLSS
jgi:hypothetical protein